MESNCRSVLGTPEQMICRTHAAKGNAVMVRTIDENLGSGD
jgi:hypothetical protein